MTNRQPSVGIVTFTFGVNFGCHLQRYALQVACERLGYQARAILLSHGDLVKPSRPGTIKRARYTLRRFREKARQKSYYDLLFGAQRRRKKAFDAFEKKFLNTTKRFYSYASIKASYESLGFDAYVAGSDQIWNPLGMGVPDCYNYFMLDFVPSDKKIAYAPSVAVSKLADKYVERFQRYLSDFRFLSAREIEGARELERILGREVPVVVDPTGLLTSDAWDVLADQAKPLVAEKYVLCYSLSNLEAILRHAKKVQKALDCPIVCFEEDRKSDRLAKELAGDGAVVVRNAGPCEFVNYIKHAECVITDSFHGAIFPIVYRRPFYAMTRDRANQEESMNSRIFTLLSTLKLEDRLFEPDDERSTGVNDVQIDYRDVETRLRECVDFSLTYLKNALAAVTGQNNES